MRRAVRGGRLMSETSSAPGATPGDDVLVRRAQDGDTAAFDELVRRHLRRAYAVAYRFLGNREDAEDVVQDAFVRAFDRIIQCDASRGFGPWMYRIVVNQGINHRRSRVRRPAQPIDVDPVSPAAGPEEAAERSDVRAQFARALAALPERQRTIVQLVDVEGFTATEVGAMLEIPAGTVRWHLHEARQTLRRALAPWHDARGEAARGGRR